MVTKEQAMTERYFHYAPVCKRIVGPRGGVTVKTENWRASGSCKTWKTRPNEFRLPIKYGLRQSSYLTQAEAHDFHVERECPLLAEREA